MRYEVGSSKQQRDEWRVEAIDYDSEGEVYVAIFSGPDAQRRAEEYAAWKNTPERRAQYRAVEQDRRQGVHA